MIRHFNITFNNKQYHIEIEMENEFCSIEFNYISSEIATNIARTYKFPRIIIDRLLDCRLNNKKPILLANTADRTFHSFKAALNSIISILENNNLEAKRDDESSSDDDDYRILPPPPAQQAPELAEALEGIEKSARQNIEEMGKMLSQQLNEQQAGFDKQLNGIQLANGQARSAMRAQLEHEHKQERDGMQEQLRGQNQLLQQQSQQLQQQQLQLQQLQKQLQPQPLPQEQPQQPSVSHEFSGGGVHAYAHEPQEEQPAGRTWRFFAGIGTGIGSAMSFFKPNCSAFQSSAVVPPSNMDNHDEEEGIGYYSD